MPTDEDQIDPQVLADPNTPNPPPFDELGVFEATDDPDIDYRAVVLAEAWAFEPSVIEVPKGSTVEFVVASKDTIHGFLIYEVAVNGMVIPGQVTKVTGTFDEAGTYRIVCHEYCGLLHHNMFGTVEVTQ